MLVYRVFWQRRIKWNYAFDQARRDRQSAVNRERIMPQNHHAFVGSAVSGAPLCTRVGNCIFAGAAVSGAPRFTIGGDRLYRGNAPGGAPVVTVVRGRVFAGAAVSGAPLGTINGRLVFRGAAVSGAPLATCPTGDMATLVAALVMVLESGR
jgi:hypothetical protein